MMPNECMARSNREVEEKQFVGTDMEGSLWMMMQNQAQAQNS